MKEAKQNNNPSVPHFSSLALLLLVCIPDASNTLSCHWEGRVTSVSSPLTHSDYPSNVELTMQISDVVESLEVFNLIPSNTANISIYGYNIIACVRCSDEESDIVARSILSKGVGAVITIGIPSQTVSGYHVTHKQLSLLGAPVEMDQSCSSAVCDPVWVAPLPTSQEHHQVNVHISTSGGNHKVQSSQFILHIDGYWMEMDNSPLSAVSKLIIDTSKQYQLKSLQPTSLYYLSPLTSPMFLPSGDRGIVFSSNHFKDSVFLQVMPITSTRACGEDASFVVTLPDRLLYFDSQAAFELFGKFAVVSHRDMDFIPIDVTASCIKSIVVPPHSFLTDWSLYLIGRNSRDEEEIYQATIQTGKPLEFVDISDVTDSGICEFIQLENADSSCSVIDGAVSASTPHEAFFLLEGSAFNCVNPPSEPCYSIIQLTGQHTEYSWKLLVTLPQDNCTGIITSDICRTETPLNLTRLTTTARPSKHIFLWGNTLIHSPDEGVTWHRVVAYDSGDIVLLTTSGDGQMVILNENQEIWYGLYGSTISLTKLRPSHAWQLNDALTGTSEIHKIVKSISVYFDSNHSLIEIFISEDESDGMLSLSSRVIPAARILSLQKESSPLTTGLTTNSTTAWNHQTCPFSSFLVVAELDQATEKLEQYEISPPSLTKSRLHDQNSLLVYQGLLHLIMDLRESGSKMAYAGDRHNPLEEWINSKMPLEPFHEYVYRNRLLPHDIYVALQPFKNDGIQVKEGKVFTLPAAIFLDKGNSYKFKVELSGWTQIEEANGLNVNHHSLDQIQLMVEVTHLDLLQVELTRHVDHLRDMVEYTVTLEDRSSKGHTAPPGRLLQASSITLEAWKSALNCFEETVDDTAKTKGYLEMKVFHGCPPGRVLQYDINGTILYNGINSVYECPQVEPKLPCVYFKHEFHPLFEVFDTTTGTSEPFTGSYTLKVIGGQGIQEAEMTYFTPEEIAKYNWIDRNTLIWVPLQLSSEKDSITIFDRNNNGLVWRCKQFSPCSDIPLNFPWMPEYKFLIEVSNKDIESTCSYCEYTVQFMVKVHGLPISALRSVRIVAWCLLLSCCIIGLFLLCDWDERRLWKCTRLWVLRGFRIQAELGSREWGIHKSESGSGSSFVSTSGEDAFVTRRRLNRKKFDRAEITWNLTGSWSDEKPSIPLEKITEEVVESENL